MSFQEDIFITQEADNWFIRNKETIIARKIENDICCTLIQNNLDCSNITSVLELGCSNGYRLNFLKKLFPNCTKFIGSDASKIAVQDGIKRYKLELYSNSLYSFNYPEQFDLIIVNFVLHWIDRNLIYKSIAAIDSLLKDNGILCLGDFLPFTPHKRIYHHYTKEPVYTYKLDYKNIFLASNQYQLMQELIWGEQPLDNNNRCSTSLLRKCNFFYNNKDI